MNPQYPLALPPVCDLSMFRDEVLAHYRDNRRDMPWRETDDPYAVLVSEVMLQQTQVARVLTHYPEWLAAFPTIDALATASLAAVLEKWQGLGYNRRAVALKRCAEICSERFAGELPRELAELRALPGIGPATAAAIANYAFGIPVPFIETNVRAAVLHHFFEDTTAVPDSALMPIVEATWDPDSPREWGYALMDYGAHLKRTLPNPSRRSRHHVRQSSFEGSHRQRRARVLREVLSQPGLEAGQYAALVGTDDADALGILEELAPEGFVERSGDTWIVPG